MSSGTVTGWVDLSGVWGRITERASERNAQKVPYASSRYWHRDTHFVGLCGEWCYAVISGQVVDERLLAEGDGGSDFGPVDVKTTTYWREPWLREFTKTRHPPLYYALVAVDLERRRARYVGYADRELVTTAPIEDLRHGWRFVLRGDQLRPELPPCHQGWKTLSIPTREKGTYPMPSTLQGTVVGHAGSDAEQRYTPSGAQLASFSVAVNDGRKQPDGSWSDDTIWVRVTCFGNLAEKALKQVVSALGRLSARPWTNRDGEPQAGIEMTASTLLVLTRQDERSVEAETRNHDADLPF
jgi:single-strand DNA-binding protein